MEKRDGQTNGLDPDTQVPGAQNEVTRGEDGTVYKEGASRGVYVAPDAQGGTEAYPSGQAPREGAYKDATQEVLSDARGLSRELAQKAAEQAREVAKQVQQQGVGALEDGKVQLAEQIYGVAKALRRGSEQFRTDDLGGLADLSDDLAEQADAVQRYLKERRGDALLRDLKTFATERRALFVGSLFVTGLLAVRFIGASNTERKGSPGSRAQAARRTPASASPTVVARGGVRSYPKAEG